MNIIKEIDLIEKIKPLDVLRIKKYFLLDLYIRTLLSLLDFLIFN